jgi:hypothetical protein
MSQSYVGSGGSDSAPSSMQFNEGDENVFRLAGGVSAGIQGYGFYALTGDREPVFPIGFQFRFGYSVKKNMYSLLLGPEFIDEMFIPISLEYRYMLNYNDKTPFAYAQAGYSWHLAGTYQNQYQFVPYTDYDAGLTFGGGLGYSIMSGQSEFIFSVGYRFQNMQKANYVSFTERDVFQIDIHAIEIKVGLIFR